MSSIGIPLVQAESTITATGYLNTELAESIWPANPGRKSEMIDQLEPPPPATDLS
jgi:hypothetical protein